MDGNSGAMERNSEPSGSILPGRCSEGGSFVTIHCHVNQSVFQLKQIAASVSSAVCFSVDPFKSPQWGVNTQLMGRQGCKKV